MLVLIRNVGLPTTDAQSAHLPRITQFGPSFVLGLLFNVQCSAACLHSPEDDFTPRLHLSICREAFVEYLQFQIDPRHGRFYT